MRLPAQARRLRVFRIDAHHARYGDDSSAERLLPVEQSTAVAPQFNWTGPIPGRSVLLLRADADASVNPVPLR
jgi:hypothetical protein